MFAYLWYLSLQAAAFSTEQTNFWSHLHSQNLWKHFDPHHSCNDHSIAGLNSHWVLTDSCGVEDVEATEAADKAEVAIKAEGFVLRLVCSLVGSSECFSSSSRSSWFAKGAITLLLELLHNDAFWYSFIRWHYTNFQNSPKFYVHTFSILFWMRSSIPKKLNFGVQKILHVYLGHCIPFEFVCFFKSKVLKKFQNWPLCYNCVSPPGWGFLWKSDITYVLFCTISYIGPIVATHGSPNIRPFCQY